MFTFSSFNIKAIIIGLSLLVCAVLSFGIFYYHNAWVNSLGIISKLETESVQLRSTIQDNNLATQKLQDMANAKDKELRLSQEKARLLSKKNQIISQSLLMAKPKASDPCESAVILYQEYKSK